MATKARTLHVKRRSHDYDKRRGTPAERGYDARWQRFRDKVYAVRHPAVCVICGHAGISKEMHVDHIESIANRPDLKYAESNLRWLCRSCHSRKTVLSDGGFGFKTAG